MKTIPMSFLYNNLRLCVVLLSSFSASILFSAKADPCTYNTKYEGGKIVTSNVIADISNGYNYEFWQQEAESAGSMTVFGGNADCAFKAEWNDSGDFLARVGYFELFDALHHFGRYGAFCLPHLHERDVLPETSHKTEHNRETRPHKEMREYVVAVLQGMNCSPYYKCEVQHKKDWYYKSAHYLFVGGFDEVVQHVAQINNLHGGDYRYDDVVVVVGGEPIQYADSQYDGAQCI